MSLSNFTIEPQGVTAIPAESLAKTSFGVITDLSVIMSDFMYLRDATVKGVRNVPAGYVFCASKHKSVDTWETVPAGKSYGALYAKPSEACLRAIEPRCCEGSIGSFEIIPWPHTGHALIVARDTVHIANPFVAFIPLDNLPAINSGNTPVRGKTWRFEVSFNGRAKGALGVDYFITADVMAKDEQAALIALYDRFDHVSFPVFTQK